MSDTERKVPPDLVELLAKVLRRMVATYGKRFWAQYQGAEEADVRIVWARELSGYVERQHAVAWAFENLPEDPPNAIGFRNLCRRCPAQPTPELPEPAVDPAIVARELQRSAQLLKTAPADPTAWADKILQRKAAGEHVPRGVLTHAAAARRRNVADPVKT